MKRFWCMIRRIKVLLEQGLGYFLGGRDELLLALGIFVVVECITGVLCAIADHKQPLKPDLRGICRRVMIFVIVGMANLLDTQIICAGRILRTSVIFFYLCKEGECLLEKAGCLGVPIPEKLRKVLEQLHNRDDGE